MYRIEEATGSSVAEVLGCVQRVSLRKPRSSSTLYTLLIVDL